MMDVWVFIDRIDMRLADQIYFLLQSTMLNPQGVALRTFNRATMHNPAPSLCARRTGICD